MLKVYKTEYAKKFSSDYFILDDDEILVTPHIYTFDKSLYATVYDVIQKYKEDQIE